MRSCSRAVLLRPANPDDLTRVQRESRVDRSASRLAAWLQPDSALHPPQFSRLFPTRFVGAISIMLVRVRPVMRCVMRIMLASVDVRLFHTVRDSTVVRWSPCAAHMHVPLSSGRPSPELGSREKLECVWYKKQSWISSPSLFWVSRPTRHFWRPCFHFRNSYR